MSNLVWLLAYVPLLPTSPIKLFFGLWVLLPQYQGESVVYLCLSDQLHSFEAKIEEVHSNAVSYIMLIVLQWTRDLVLRWKSNVNETTLPMLVKWTEKIDLALKTETANRKKAPEESKEAKVSTKRKLVAEDEPVK
jgi:hypothetical protein